MKLIAMVLVVASGCAKFDRYMPATALIVSSALVACDAAQTIRVASEGWPDGRRETNWLMSDRPSVATIATYNLGVIVANVAVWALTPKKYRSIAPAALAGMEAHIIHNHDLVHGVGYCGERKVRR